MDTGKSKFWIIVLMIFASLLSYKAGYHKGAQSITPITKDSIIVKDSILIDSIFIENKEIEQKIIYLEKILNETIPVINNNTDSANLVIFTDYINSYNNQ